MRYVKKEISCYINVGQLLHKKIERDPAHLRCTETVWNAGYRFSG